MLIINLKNKNKMKNIYYKIWVDAIFKIKSNPDLNKTWKFYSMIYMSTVMALNLWFFSFLMLTFKCKISFYPFEINIFSIEKINSFLSFFASYLLPMLVINYFLIFWNNRYEKLLLQYKAQNGKLFSRYFLCSILIYIFYFLIVFILFKLFPDFF
jgi:hypothetical protein